MDDFDQLIIGVPVFELFVDVSQVVEIELALALDVKQGEVGFATFLREGAALNRNTLTMRAVSSLRKPSKSRAAP